MPERKTPQVRFKGFTDTWEQRKLSTLTAEFRSGEGIKSDDIKENGTYPVYGGNGLRGYAEQYNHDGEYALIGRQGALCGNMNFSVGKAYFTEHAVAVKANENNDTKFLYYLLDKMNLGQYSDQSAQPGLAVNKLSALKEFVPRKQEQIKISSYLKDLDHLITLHQREGERLQMVKKSMLENCFPKNGEKVPRFRFAGFTGDWEQRKLKDIANVIDPHPSHRAPAATETGIPFIGIGDVDEAGNINHSTARIVDEKIYDEHHKRYDLSIPSIGISRVASLGKVIRLRNDIGKYAVSPTMSIIQFYPGVDGDYVYSCISSPLFQKQFSSQSNGSTRQSVGIQDLRELIVLIPPIVNEQKEIGTFFWNFDNLITLHQHKLDQLQTLKKFMLQNLFI